MTALTHLDWLVLFAALVSSFAACAVIVLTQRWHGGFSLDHDLGGAQKFHTVPVPRIGGVGLLMGLAVAALAWMSVSDVVEHESALWLLACGAPAFLAGLWEDMTKKVSVRTRLMATFGSAALAVWLLDAQLLRLDIPLVDDLMLIAPIAVAFTCFAVAGVANAVNIIDGFNGLAAGSAVLMLLGLAGLGWLADDVLVIKLCLMGAAALIGFLFLNFPFGKIFLGDGGAYLVGFWLAECAVLLLVRNPEVSTWAVLLCCIYPVWETLFSMWRKSVVRKTGMGRPDKLHFHMLIYRRWTSRVLSSKAPVWQRHMLTTLAIATLVASFQAMAWVVSVSVGTHAAFLAGIGAFALAYTAIYRDLTIRMTGDQGEPASPLPNVN